MVAAEEVPLQTSAVRGAAAPSRRTQLAAVTALVCISLLVAPLVVSRDNSAGVVLEEKDDEISDNLLGALEKAMDKSIDNKVEAFMSAPGVASIPIPKFPEKDEEHEEVEHDDEEEDEIPKSYLEHLQTEKEALEKKRGELLNDLRAEHTAVATEAAKQSIEANKIRLESALYRAKKRQLENAQDAARQAAKKMREALIAKQHAIHAEAVAKARAHILDSMVSEAQAGAGGAPTVFKAPSATKATSLATAATASTAAATASVKPRAAPEAKEEHKTKAGGSLARYEAQEKVLLKKIAAAKRKASLEAAQASGKASSEGKAKKEAMEGKVIQTLAKTVKKNQSQIESDEAKAAQLKKQELKLLASVQAMKAKNTALQVKEQVLAH